MVFFPIISIQKTVRTQHPNCFFTIIIKRSDNAVQRHFQATLAPVVTILSPYAICGPHIAFYLFCAYTSKSGKKGLT